MDFMSERTSRRDLMKLGLAGAASLAVPTASAHDSPKPQEAPALAKPLTGEAKRLYDEMLKGVQNNAKERLKHPLPENSEPCFIYRATEVKRR